MRRLHIILAICLMCLGPAAMAADARLRELATVDDGKGWEAVGRLNLGRWGFCTGALIAPDLVLTAAHCLFDQTTGEPFDMGELEFLAGWRNGRAEAYRRVRHGVVHPRYLFQDSDRINRVAYDLALLRLDHPIRLPGVTPFETAQRPRKGDNVGVVSYAEDRAEAPSLQEICHVLAGRPGVLMLSCDVNFGSSGAPVFTFRDGVARIVSVVSSKADLNDDTVALSAALDDSLALLRKRMEEGDVLVRKPEPVVRRFGKQGAPTGGGAKFIRP